MTRKVFKLSDKQWQAIRQHWEFDPDEPNMVVAAQRAGERLGFTPPTRQALNQRQRRELEREIPWQRRHSMTGMVAAAQRKADVILQRNGRKMMADVEKTVQEHIGEKGDPKADAPLPESYPDPDDAEGAAELIQDARAYSEDRRAEVIARHRIAWSIIDVLREEALKARKTDMDDAQNKMRFAKVTAEVVTIQQTGERKAWGLDDIQIPDLTKKSDAELKAIVEGKGA